VTGRIWECASWAVLQSYPQEGRISRKKFVIIIVVQSMFKLN